MPKKKIAFREGDIFLIPSCTGGFYVGQVAKDTTREAGVPFCYIYDGRLTEEKPVLHEPLKAENVISAAFITHELIIYGAWRIIGNENVPDHDAAKVIPQLRKQGFVGLVVVGGGLVAKYLDTFHGHIAQEQWPDISYVTKFFLSKPRTTASMP